MFGKYIDHNLERKEMDYKDFMKKYKKRSNSLSELMPNLTRKTDQSDRRDNDSSVGGRTESPLKGHPFIRSLEENKIKSLKFENSINRKEIFINPAATDVLTYCSPIGQNRFDELGKIIDLRRHTKRKDPPLKNIPSVGLYHPKDDYTLKNLNNVVSYQQEDKFKKKHYLVQKMWRSYNATIDYRIVQLKSYMEEQNKKAR